MNKEEKFLKFMKKMEDCQGCPMRNFGSPVFSGNHMQEMMMIGYEPESHNVHINSDIVSKASKLLTLYENEVKYGAYITYLYRCSLYVHGAISEEGKKNCMRFLKEEIEIIRPKYIIIYDKRVIDIICDDPEAVVNAAKYPVAATVLGAETSIYYIG